jgi:hypothetical protein
MKSWSDTSRRKLRTPPKRRKAPSPGGGALVIGYLVRGVLADPTCSPNHAAHQGRAFGKATHMPSLAASFPTTITSSGTAADGGWQRWWCEQSRLDGTDWESLLRRHQDVFRRLCERVGVSS